MVPWPLACGHAAEAQFTAHAQAPAQAAAPRPAAVSLTIDPSKVLHRIDEKVYGHFLEHIYHSVNGGLWGELVWGRSFEESRLGGAWSVEDGNVVQKGLGTNVRLPFGDPTWSDYEFQLEAQKLGGAEGFLILFRVAGDEDFYWLNLGGWGNARHAIERGNHGAGRWGVVSPSVEGSIEKDRWYSIRIRCEGRRIQVFLDEKRIIDLTDGEKAQLRGRVGVGTWATKACFRNLKVTGLDGRTLFQGLPEVLTEAGVAKWWEAYGTGTLRWTGESPLNGDYCQMIDSDGDETGLRQRPFAVVRGEKYRGSVWTRGARGAAPEGLVVRFVAGARRLGEAALPAPVEAWRECPFEIEPAESATDATLEIGARGKGRVWIDQVSLMAASAAATGGFRPDLLEAVAGLKPPVIRWPGGCFAEWYRWKDGVGPQHRRVRYPIEIWDDVDADSYGTDEFVRMCRRVGAEPLIVINIGHHDGPEKRGDYIREACEWVEYSNGPASSKWGAVRASNGHPEPYRVKYWEISNETWVMGPEPYAQAVREFVPALKKVDPSIRIAVCGSAGYGRGGIGLAWNRVLLDRCADLMDYLSIHHYEDPNRFAQGPRDYEAFFRETGALIARSRNPAIRVFVSEWNAQSTDWRTGLYAGGILNAFERAGDAVGMASPALFLRHTSASDWDNAFINFDHRGWFPAPNYVVMRLWRESFAPLRVELTGSGASGPLNALATRSEDGRRIHLKAVNPTEGPVDVDVGISGGSEIEKASLEIVAPDALAARNTLERPDAVRTVPGSVKVQGSRLSFTMPRWSAAVATVEVVPPVAPSTP